MARLPLAAIGLVLGAASGLSPANAAPGGPVAIGEGITLDPIVAARLRYESVDQDGFAENAEALTLRTRLGAELKASNLSFLAEAEGTVALRGRYNDTLPRNGIEPIPVVADPENLELNRLQIAWAQDGAAVTVGRQRLVFDNARFVGNVGWRQNEQTFDAVRGQARSGPVTLDAAYAVSQRTVFGVDSPNSHFDGDLVLLNAGVALPGIEAKAFGYLVDYDDRTAFSSQTYGVLVQTGFGLPGGVQARVVASYATQGDLGANPVPYRADYWSAELGLALFGLHLTAGYEELGSDGGVAAFQTPLATLHAFNGWADMFLTTPPAGLRDYYAGLGYRFTTPALRGLRLDVVYHRFESDFGWTTYGHEWDASLGINLGLIALTAKYARYQARSFGTDTTKAWLQAELAF